jgi:hypothetical protein
MTAATIMLRLACALALSGEMQTVTAPALKAAFLYNFAKFATWPVGHLPPGQNLALCVLDDAAVAEALQSTIKGQSVDGHSLAVQVVRKGSPVHWCHVLYVGDLPAKDLAQLSQYAADAGVFTVGSHHNFAEQGGIAQLVLDNDRMRFAINVTAAQRARVTLSSRMLSLATIIKDPSHGKN